MVRIEDHNDFEMRRTIQTRFYELC